MPGVAPGKWYMCHCNHGFRTVFNLMNHKETEHSKEVQIVNHPTKKGMKMLRVKKKYEGKDWIFLMGPVIRPDGSVQEVEAPPPVADAVEADGGAEGAQAVPVVQAVVVQNVEKLPAPNDDDWKLRAGTKVTVRLVQVQMPPEKLSVDLDTRVNARDRLRPRKK